MPAATHSTRERNRPKPVRPLGDAEREQRDRLVTQYRPYVFKVARSILALVPGLVEYEELVSWGSLGLIEAATRFDETKGVTFRSYAHLRIRGAMFDALRRERGRGAAGTVQLSDMAEWAPDCLIDRALCLDAGYVQGWALPKFSNARALLSTPPDAPDRAAWRTEIRTHLEDAFGTLDPLERLVVLSHYVNGESVQTIARRMNKSKSWLSRVHSRALAKLRQHLLLANTKEGLL